MNRYGAFGGRTEADAECQMAADEAGLLDTWRALLSTPDTSARDALSLDGPLLNMMDETVATGDADPWDGTLGAAVAYDPHGNTAGSMVRTGTEPDGSISTTTCQGWTASTGSVDGNTGNSHSMMATWMSDSLVGCSKSARFYCVSDE